MSLYLENGYINEKEILDKKAPFIIQIGGRGIGKTYGVLSWILESGKTFLYIRRTQREADIAASSAGGVFKSIPAGQEIETTSSKQGLYIYSMHECSIGYGAALSTFSNLRGIDFSDVDIIYYDEFIPEKIKSKIKNEYETLLNLYETVNRNRELNGREPCKMVLTANANDIANPVLMGLGVVSHAVDMINKKIECKHFADRGLTLYIFQNSRISDKKRQTALYKLSSGGEYNEMALNNIFAVDQTNIKPLNRRGLIPLCKIGEIVISRKRNGGYYVACMNVGAVKDVFTLSDDDRERFKLKYSYLYYQHMLENVTYQDIASKILFVKLLTT